jgi:hypothetical protein
MSILDIRVRDSQTEFPPGEAIEGSASWQLDRSAEALELRLIWWTAGKGDMDASIEDTRRFEAPGTSGNSNFRFALPDAPYSFSGRLITLSWALELVVMPGEEATRYEFSLSPDGKERHLPEGEALNSAKQLPGWMKSRIQRGNDSSSVLQQSDPFNKSTS